MASLTPASPPAPPACPAGDTADDDSVTEDGSWPLSPRASADRVAATLAGSDGYVPPGLRTPMARVGPSRATLMARLGRPRTPDRSACGKRPRVAGYDGAPDLAAELRAEREGQPSVPPLPWQRLMALETMADPLPSSVPTPASVGDDHPPAAPSRGSTGQRRREYTNTEIPMAYFLDPPVRAPKLRVLPPKSERLKRFGITVDAAGRVVAVAQSAQAALLPRVCGSSSPRLGSSQRVHVGGDGTVGPGMDGAHVVGPVASPARSERHSPSRPAGSPPSDRSPSQMSAVSSSKASRTVDFVLSQIDNVAAVRDKVDRQDKRSLPWNCRERVKSPSRNGNTGVEQAATRNWPSCGRPSIMNIDLRARPLVGRETPYEPHEPEPSYVERGNGVAIYDDPIITESGGYMDPGIGGGAPGDGSEDSADGDDAAGDDLGAASVTEPSLTQGHAATSCIPSGRASASEPSSCGIRLHSTHYGDGGLGGGGVAYGLRLLASTGEAEYRRCRAFAASQHAPDMFASDLSTVSALLDRFAPSVDPAPFVLMVTEKCIDHYRDLMDMSDAQALLRTRLEALEDRLVQAETRLVLANERAVDITDRFLQTSTYLHRMQRAYHFAIPSGIGSVRDANHASPPADSVASGQVVSARDDVVRDNLACPFPARLDTDTCLPEFWRRAFTRRRDTLLAPHGHAGLFVASTESSVSADDEGAGGGLGQHCLQPGNLAT